MIEKNKEDISIRQQAKILGINRTKIYYKIIIKDNSMYEKEIIDTYEKSGCRYGYRKIHAELRKNNDFKINIKKVAKIMNELNISGIKPKRKIVNKKNEDISVYPYLLSDIVINKKDKVWATDITYIRVGNKFMYFIAIIDLYSRYIVEYGLSPSLDASYYAYILQQAIKKGKPDIFNTDQGSQFTSKIFLEILKKNNIKISMDHKGRCFDNIYVERLWRTVKQEAIYYYKPETIKDLEKILIDFVEWYNKKRVHQSLNYRKPYEVYYSSS
jgi:putative transposase